LHHRARPLQAQRVAEAADLDLAADVALRPAVGGAGIEPELAEARAGIEAGMAALELAGGQAGVEIEARLAVTAGDADLQRRARRLVEHHIGAEQGAAERRLRPAALPSALVLPAPPKASPQTA
jgi:hypothetical protein